MTPKLKKQYVETVVPTLMQKLQYKNIHEVPKLVKVVINRGIGNVSTSSILTSQNQKMLDSANKELSLISGQKGVITRSKKSIASFKIRENMPVGVTVTLRGHRMYDFLYRLIHLALPRVLNFQGVNPKGFDKHGNFSLGLPEQLMFPEISFDQIQQIRGMDITIVTTALNPEEGLALLTELGFLFRC
uniref:Large ribosomal subunit protein uL5c n=1 Tax=Polytoma uvella TaxID=40532 RepID=A0A1L2M5D1_9CHLO|nr:ribosomal protein L5 [Polytoma uvella]